jgi:hypothetical protein
MHPLVDKVNDRSIKSSGTTYQDWMAISKSEIIDAFGKEDPDENGWIIQFKNGVVSTIYAQGRGVKGMLWHIGGFNQFAPIMVKMIILQIQDKHELIDEIFEVKA